MRRRGNATTFTKSRERFEKHGLLRKFFERVVAQAYVEEWASSDHFTVDGTLIESYASLKSLRPKDSGVERVSEGSDDDDGGNPTVNFRGEKRKNETHQSVVDPEARLYRKSYGVAAKLCHGAHVLMENRNGLVVDVQVSEANGRGERTEAPRLVRRAKRRHGLKMKTLAADRGYAAGAFLHELEAEAGVVPLVAMPDVPIKSKGVEADARRRAKRRRKTKRYAVAQRIRKRVEEINGWTTEIGGMRRTRHVGRWKINQMVLVVPRRTTCSGWGGWKRWPWPDDSPRRPREAVKTTPNGADRGPEVRSLNVIGPQLHTTDPTQPGSSATC